MRTTEHPVRRAVVGLLGLGIGLMTAACGHGGDTAGSAPVTAAPVPSARTEVLPAPESSRTGQAGGDSRAEDDPQAEGDTQAAPPATPVESGDQPATTVYAELVEAGRATPSGHWLRYDQLTRLTGKAAIDYQKKHNPGEEPFSDWYLNQNPRLRDVVLSEDAVIHGTSQLGTGGSDPVRLTPEQLVDRVEQHPRALVKLVVRVVDGRTQVVALDEVYSP